MATVNHLSCSSKQTCGGLSSTIDYCEREAKTTFEGSSLITGINCNAENAYTEMMCTKNQYDKTDGRMYYYLVQSFHPDEKITPEEAHKVACEFAESQFKKFEVVVATHVDANHIHSHFVINSVSFEDGKKYHSSKNDLQKLRDASDEICKKHGLSVVEPSSKKEAPRLGTREYRSALKDQSFKITLSANIIDVMSKAKTREEFIGLMEERGYKVAWEDNRKYITYTTPDGKKCRDNKLHENRFRKEVMTNEFRIRQELQRSYIESNNQFASGSETNAMRSDNGGKLDFTNSGDTGIDKGYESHERGSGEFTLPRRAGDICKSDVGNSINAEGRDSSDLSGELQRPSEYQTGMGQGIVTTGWEAERELCFSVGANQEYVPETVQEVSLDSVDMVSVDVDIDGVLSALSSIGGSTSDVDEEDKKHKQYVTEHNPNYDFGQSM